MTYSKDDLVNYLYNVADRYGIDRAIAYAQINQESGFNPNAVSPSGAIGIAQFMPDTAKRFGLTNPYDPIASLEAYGEYMNSLLSMFGWRYDLALAAYNSGENRAEYQAAYSQDRAINWSALPTRVQAETPHYVDLILGSAGYTENDAVAMAIGGGGDGIAAAGGGNGGGAGDGSSSLPAWLIVGAIGLAAVIFLRD